MNKTWILATLAALALGSHTSIAQVATVPEGYVTVTIAAGTGTTKSSTPISFPLLEVANVAGQVSGRITGVTATTITNSAASWTPGQLSTAATPYVLRITSGTATGRTFLLSTATASTATTVTIDSTESINTNLTTLGITVGASGDTYQLIPCDTISSLFGTPASRGIVAGTSAANGDNLIISVNGASFSYYFSSSLVRWTRASLGNPDATNVAVRPDAGVIFSRLGNTSIVLTALGRVPATDRKSVVMNSGATYLAQGWPTDMTLLASGIQNTPNWTSNIAVASADTVQLTISGQNRIYWFDGTNWRRQALGSPISNTQIMSAGANVILNQRGVQTGTSIIAQALPYGLD
ncbi:MAG: hypothetical protein SH807_09110 [Blastochloris sp.]|nr:hypothetical protein [Blastochloris sp.]